MCVLEPSIVTKIVAAGYAKVLWKYYNYIHDNKVINNDENSNSCNILHIHIYSHIYKTCNIPQLEREEYIDDTIVMIGHPNNSEYLSAFY